MIRSDQAENVTGETMMITVFGDKAQKVFLSEMLVNFNLDLSRPRLSA